MKEWLISVSESVILAIYALALLVIVIATVEVAIAAVRAAVLRKSNHFLREAWLRYARWLVAALTLQLAADIIVVPCRVVPRSNSAIFEGSLWSTREVKLAIDELGIAEGTFVMLFDG